MTTDRTPTLEMKAAPMGECHAALEQTVRRQGQPAPRALAQAVWRDRDPASCNPELRAAPGSNAAPWSMPHPAQSRARRRPSCQSWIPAAITASCAISLSAESVDGARGLTSPLATSIPLHRAGELRPALQTSGFGAPVPPSSARPLTECNNSPPSLSRRPLTDASRAYFIPFIFKLIFFYISIKYRASITAEIEVEK